MRTAIKIIWLLVTAVLAVCLSFERQAALKLERDNANLRQRLGQPGGLLAENQHLFNLLAGAERSPAGSNLPAERSASADENELVRLRVEVESFRQQNKEIQALKTGARESRSAAETVLKTKNGNYDPGTANGSQFELVSADYGTSNTNLDVTEELRARIRRDSLKAIASNNLKGDPEFGQTKHLTVVYRYGGVTLTNQFREGDFVDLPKSDYYFVPGGVFLPPTEQQP